MLSRAGGDFYTHSLSDKDLFTTFDYATAKKPEGIFIGILHNTKFNIIVTGKEYDTWI